MRNVYVAGKFEEADLVRQVQTAVLDRGHRISWDWTKENAGARKGLALHSYFRRCAEQDFNGVINADVVLMLNHKNGYGLMVELGIALARNIPVVMLGPDERDTVFFHLPGVHSVDNLAEALDLVDLVQRVR